MHFNLCFFHYLILKFRENFCKKTKTVGFIEAALRTRCVHKENVENVNKWRSVAAFTIFVKHRRRQFQEFPRFIYLCLLICDFKKFIAHR
jgi:hypothetical protein